VKKKKEKDRQRVVFLPWVCKEKRNEREGLREEKRQGVMQCPCDKG
jgi:hypothetical protein